MINLIIADKLFNNFHNYDIFSVQILVVHLQDKKRGINQSLQFEQLALDTLPSPVSASTVTSSVDAGVGK